MGNEIDRIEFLQPLDLEATLLGGQAFRWRREGDWYVGILGSNLIWIRYQLDWLTIDAYPERTEVVRADVLRHLRADDDVSAIIRRVVQREPSLLDATRHCLGLRLLRQDPWECLISFLCSSNTNVPRIGKMIQNLCQGLGRPIGDRSFTFPTPVEVAVVGEEILREFGLGYRAKYVARTAMMIARGEFQLSSIAGLSYEQAKWELMTLPGVGAKVADCVLLFSLEYLDAFPVDRWVRRAVLRYHGDQTEEGDRSIVDWARETFGRDAGYVNQILFHEERLKAGRFP